MAHYAYIDDNNMVITVIVGKDETELIDGLDTETYYALNTPYRVKRTSYNSKIRGTYAGIGFTYNEDEDIFVAPQPFPSWIRSGSFWNAPSPKPEGFNWTWDEENLMWQQLES